MAKGPQPSRDGLSAAVVGEQPLRPMLPPVTVRAPFHGAQLRTLTNNLSIYIIITISFIHSRLKREGRVRSQRAVGPFPARFE